MRFKAKIQYTFTQSLEAKRMGDDNIIDTEIEFTFQDLLGQGVQIQGNRISFMPSFSIRELLIPWLKQGNIPELIKDE